MWNPVRNKEHESKQLISYYASKGLQKELDKINKKIKNISDQLLASEFKITTKRRQTIRTQLSLECEQRDRLEFAIETCKHLNEKENQMAKLLINNEGSTKATIPVQTIKELGWTKETVIDVKRVGKKVVITEVLNEKL